MRDNLHDDLFADHAWQEMQKVLDREMPERKRRGFLFWLLPALGFCVLLGRDTTVNTKIPVASEKPNQNTRAIAQGDENPVIKAELRSKTNPEKPALQAAQHQSEKLNTTNPVVAELARAVAPALQRNKKGMQKQPLLPQSNQQQPGSMAAQNAELVSTTSMPTVLDVSNKDQEAVVSVLSTLEKTPVTNVIHAEEEAKISSSDPIATRHFDLAAPEAKSEEILLNAIRAKQKLEWWAEAGTQMTNGISGLSGYRAGLLAGIPIGKLRMRIGAEYQNTQVDFKSVQRDAAGRESFTDVRLDAPLSSVSGNKGQAQTVSSIHLQFINLNLSLYHPIGKRFGLSAGGSMLYLEGIRLGDQYVKGPLFNTSNANNDVVNSPGNGFLGQAQQNGSLSPNNFKTLGFALQGEFSYRISPRWGLNLGYRHSLQHLTKSADLLLKPNWVDVGVRYRLK